MDNDSAANTNASSETATTGEKKGRFGRKIELSIKAEYLPHWGTFEGVREFIQNGRDAAVEFGDTFSVWHDAKTSRLFVENVGTTIPMRALLIGHTSKANRGDLAGQFGEGLDAGLLVLTRAGHEVIVRNGGEVWCPLLEHSAAFGADVLKIEVASGRKEVARVRVEIGGIGAEVWAEMKKSFRFLDEKKAGKGKDSSVLSVDAGDILLDPDMAGRLFVKGIYVGREEGLGVGYDFSGSDVKVDRDRKMVASWDLRWRTGTMWRQASHLLDVAGKIAIDKLVALAFEGRDDVGTASEPWQAEQYSEAAKTAILARFVSENGTHAHPVDSIQESMELEHSNKVGVRTSKSVRTFVEGKLGKLEDVKQALLKAVLREYGSHELTASEKTALKRAMRMLNDADAAMLEGIPVDIVEYRDPSILGLYQVDEGGTRISLARSTLGSWDQALLVLIHEACHRAGTDGSDGHDRLIQDTWRKVVVSMAAAGGEHV